MNIEALIARAQSFSGKSKGAIPYCPYLPNSEMQRQFVFSDQFELMAGGGTGGGKTIAFMMSALLFLDRPGYHALAIRKTLPSLEAPDGPIWLSHEWLKDSGARWQGKGEHRRWTMNHTYGSPSVLQFRPCEHDDDVEKLMGPGWHWIGIEEAGEFPTPILYRKAKTRMRRVLGDTIPIRLRLTGNPGGPGQQWLYEEVVSDPQRYIHSTYLDNPSLDREHYATVLATLDKVTRQYYELGDWKAKRTGRVYEIEDRHCVDAVDFVDKDPEEAPGWRYMLGVDLGASAIKPTTALSLVAWNQFIPQKVWVLRCEKFAHISPTETAAEIRLWQESVNGYCYVTVDPGALGRGWIEEFRMRHGILAEPVDKTPGYKLTARSHFASALQHNHILVYKPDCEELLRETDMLVWNDKGLDVEDGAEDHASDATLYAFLACRAYQSKAIPIDTRTKEQRLQDEALERKRKLGQKLLEEMQLRDEVEYDG